jgi:hypothetical protein
MATFGKLCLRVTLLMMIVAAMPRVAEAASTIADTAAKRCEELASTDFSDIEDVRTQIVDANIVEAKDGQGAAYCRVQNYIWPQVGFELRLPISSWNLQIFRSWFRRLFQQSVLGDTLSAASGYACIASDMGHKGKSQNLSWSYNNLQAQSDYGIRGTHVTALAAITARYYIIASDKAYFLGCSTGGRQALAEAQTMGP